MTERPAAGQRVAIVGVGHWGRYAARDLVALGAETHAVCRSEPAITNAQAAGVASIVSTVDELPEVDGVVVCTRATEHYEVIDRLDDRGVPVFVEKPLTTDVAQARELVERLGERLFVMDKWRYHGGVRELARIAADGRLGAVRALRTRRVGPRVSSVDVDITWMLLPHELSIAIEIFGEALELRTVDAVTEAGRALHMCVSMGTDPWHAIEVSSIAPAVSREITLICEHGAAWVPDSYADHVSVREHGRDDDPERVPVSTEMPLELELRAFLEHLRGGPRPVSSAAEGLRSVELIARMRELAGLPASS